MKSARISGGNALKLAEAIEYDAWSEVNGVLNRAREEATRTSATAVVISSELLLRPLSRPDNVGNLLEQLDQSGLGQPRWLVILRDPVDQCLSLYKHRAKRGTAGEIAGWVKQGYRLPEELAGFRRQVEANSTVVQVRRYDRSPGALERMFFEEWLGVPVPDVDIPTAVNPSLTHSELVLVRQMAEIRPELVEPLYEALVAVDPADKIQGESMLGHARAVAAQAVSKHTEEWDAWNELLPEDEKLEIPEPPDEVPPAPTELGLSERQMRVVSELLAESAKPGFLARLFWHSRLRPALGRIKRLGSR